ncbi:hypothetical protein GALMADRAFT_221009 [Galerina marginata CBS 339.88]|uniref:Uncharacterized protein n=1 Tax=Galerina marginata (strain CBS 339.88) TaxID=685588 RepID=A0A067TT07_GALM3|nr:hypothetical protein GALMADRAFT_221009 [Galerina marginata CBS 339.88]
MYIPNLVARDSEDPSASSPRIFGGGCKPGVVPWVKWCTLDIIVWVIVLVLVCFVCWRVYSANRITSAPTTVHSTRSNKKRYYRLSLPYPSTSPDLSVSPNDRYEHDTKAGDTSDSTLIDPYHVVHSLDRSLITKDASFEGATVPRPAFEQKRTGKIDGVGLGINMQGDSPVPTSQADEGEKITTPPPVPAHLHNARWDT